MPALLNLVANSAKVMATSGMAVIRIIIRVSVLWGILNPSLNSKSFVG